MLSEEDLREMDRTKKLGKKLPYKSPGELAAMTPDDLYLMLLQAGLDESENLDYTSLIKLYMSNMKQKKQLPDIKIKVTKETKDLCEKYGVDVKEEGEVVCDSLRVDYERASEGYENSGYIKPGPYPYDEDVSVSYFLIHDLPKYNINLLISPNLNMIISTMVEASKKYDKKYNKKTKFIIYTFKYDPNGIKTRNVPLNKGIGVYNIDASVKNNVVSFDILTNEISFKVGNKKSFGKESSVSFGKNFITPDYENFFQD